MSMRIRGCRPARRFAAPAFGLGALLCFTSSLAETVPARGIVDSRIRTAVYNGDEVYRLRGYVGYQIDLEFEPGETFTGLGAGDLEGLSFVGQDNHLFLKPEGGEGGDESDRAHQPASLSIRLHRAGTTSHGGRSGRHLLAAIYVSPAALGIRCVAAAQRLDSQLEHAGTERPRNEDYWYCGRPALKPVAASDDGIHTRLRFAANSDLPAIFVRNEDGSESLLNFNMDAGDVIVHRVAHRFIVRRGKLAGCVVNRGYTGGGTRLDSGTVTPDVERRVQGGVP